MHAFTRTLVAALAILALAAPVASARIDPPSSGPSAQTQDLQHLRAGGQAPSRGSVYAPPTPSGGAVYWSYDYQAPKPASHPAAPAKATANDDFPWLTVGFAVAGTFLLISAAAAAVAVSRRPTGARTA